MKNLRLKCFVLFLSGFLLVGNAFAQDELQNTENYFQTDVAKKARQNWILNCQGCHKIDGTGRPDKGLPDLSGKVAIFLSVEGGREYLSRVPGVTNASVNDEELTDLINWLLVRFDPDHIPQGHQPYTVEEVTQWRKQPLSIGAAQQRENLLIKIANHNSKN